MDFATIDFETFYDREYSLSKMQTDAYVLDDRFQIIGVGVKAGRDDEPVWFSDPSEHRVKEWLQDSFDWPSTAVCCHNTLFDGFIATQKLGLRPKLWMDTLSMGRMSFPWLKGHSLAALSEYFNIGKKGNEVVNALGLRLENFPPAQLSRYADYCMQDVALTHTLAGLLLRDTPPIELLLIDMSIRMFTEPRIALDIDMLKTYYASELSRKEELLERIDVGKDELMSNNKFAEALTTLGVTPPMKTSQRTGKRAYAFAKSDKAFTALLEHPDEDVQALVAARLGVKSTIAETRALRLIETAERGKFPVYLRHWGAKTTGRYSGGNSVNAQNLPNRGPARAIRNAMVAPPGHKIVVGDSSNIELRVAMCVAGQHDVLDQIRYYDENPKAGDVYCNFASKLFGREVVKGRDDRERTVGKVAMLSLQYGSGAPTFREMVRLMGGEDISAQEAERTVLLYRDMHPQVMELGKDFQRRILPAIYNGQVLEGVDHFGWVVTTHDGFAVPGLPGVVYKDLKWSASEGEWTYLLGRARPKLYGGKCVENLCQHIARHIVMWQAARVQKKFPVSLTVHDEVVCVVPDDQVDECVAWVTECLALAPKWCRGDIPLASDFGVGESYGSAKK